MSGWDAHLNTLLQTGSGQVADRQAAILTQNGLAVCAQSPALTIDSDEVRTALQQLKTRSQSIVFQGEKHTVLRYFEGDQDVVIMMKKISRSEGDENQPIQPATDKEFIVVTLTKTLIFVVKVGATDNQVDAAFMSKTLKDYLVASQM